MIITNDFVVLNWAKTGSTFVRTVLKQIHRERIRKRGLLNRVMTRAGLRAPPYYRELILPVLDQHGTYCHIPPEHRGKRVVSVARSPYTRFLSEYRFRWWADYPDDFFDREVVAEFSSFPHLSILDYVRITERQMARRGFKVPIGLQTLSFIRMFFKDPEAVLANLDEEYLNSDRYVADMPEISFLRTETLNTDLFEFLRSQGYPKAEIRFILAHERVNRSERADHQDDEPWTQDIIEWIQDRERLLFRILAAHGFHYSAPRLLASG